MKKLKVLIGEDDELQAEKLAIMLDELGYDVIGINDKPGLLKRMIKHQKPDVVLMDIHLDSTIDGIDVIKTGEFDHEFVLIYITSLSDSEVIDRVKETLPDAFLVKPVTEKQVQSTIEIAFYRRSLKQNDGDKNLVKPLECDNDVLELRSNIFIKIGNSLRKFRVSDIVCVTASRDKYSDICTLDKIYPVRKSLQDLQQVLGSVFERIHRSHLVNLNHIQKVEKNHVTLSDNKKLPISTAFKKQLEERLKVIS